MQSTGREVATIKNTTIGAASRAISLLSACQWRTPSHGSTKGTAQSSAPSNANLSSSKVQASLETIRLIIPVSRATSCAIQTIRWRRRRLEVGPPAPTKINYLTRGTSGPVRIRRFSTTIRAIRVVECSWTLLGPAASTATHPATVGIRTRQATMGRATRATSSHGNLSRRLIPKGRGLQLPTQALGNLRAKSTVEISHQQRLPQVPCSSNRLPSLPRSRPRARSSPTVPRPRSFRHI